MDNFCLRDKVKTEMMNFSLLYLEVYLLPPEPFIFGKKGLIKIYCRVTFSLTQCLKVTEKTEQCKYIEKN